MASSAKRTDPKLWERVKQDITDSDNGGEPGQWSARKAQMAVQEYKRRGGGYEGRKPKTHLDQWTEEDWGTRSGERSRDTGERYLPKKARERMSDEQYNRTSEKKRRDTRQGRQYSKQPKEAERIGAHARGQGEPTKQELYREAQRRDIPSRSRLSKDDLARALRS